MLVKVLYASNDLDHDFIKDSNISISNFSLYKYMNVYFTLMEWKQEHNY